MGAQCAVRELVRRCKRAAGLVFFCLVSGKERKDGVWFLWTEISGISVGRGSWFFLLGKPTTRVKFIMRAFYKQDYGKWVTERLFFCEGNGSFIQQTFLSPRIRRNFISKRFFYYPLV